MTYPNNRMVPTSSASRMAAGQLEAARGQADVRIDQSGLIDSTKAAIEICALVSKERIVHSVKAIACLRKSRRSSLLGPACAASSSTSGLGVIDISPFSVSTSLPVSDPAFIIAWPYFANHQCRLEPAPSAGDFGAYR